MIPFLLCAIRHPAGIGKLLAKFVRLFIIVSSASLVSTLTLYSFINDFLFCYNNINREIVYS